MASDQLISALTGTDTAGRYGSSLERPALVEPPVVIGNGDSGPRSINRFVVWEDPLPIPANELAYQASLGMPVTGRKAAGRYMPLNNDFAQDLDSSFPPDQFGPGRPGPAMPQQPWIERGVQGAQVIPAARTVYNTASVNVGYGSGDGW
jgi:hypothetical protein